MCIPGLFSAPKTPDVPAPPPIAPIQQATDKREEVANDPRKSGLSLRRARARALAARGGQSGGTILGSALGSRAGNTPDQYARGGQNSMLGQG